MILRTYQQRNRKRLLARAAFTLMEMLVVVAIIVALAGVGGYFLFGALGQSREQIAEAQVKGTLTKAVQTYYLRHNQYPDSLDQLLPGAMAGQTPILDDPTAILDPWSTASQPRPYSYDRAGTRNGGLKPDIWCVSPDTGKEIGNWPMLRSQ